MLGSRKDRLLVGTWGTLTYLGFNGLTVRLRKIAKSESMRHCLTHTNSVPLQQLQTFLWSRFPFIVEIKIPKPYMALILVVLLKMKFVFICVLLSGVREAEALMVSDFPPPPAPQASPHPLVFPVFSTKYMEVFTILYFLDVKLYDSVLDLREKILFTEYLNMLRNEHNTLA